MQANVSGFVMENTPHAPLKSSRTCWHVYSQRQRWGSDLRRHQLAQLSWHREYEAGEWRVLAVPESRLPRTSQSVLKDTRKLPFLRDLLDMAVRGAAVQDLIVFTNDDVLFAPGLGESLFHVERAAWASRHDFIRLPVLPTCLDIAAAGKHCGADLFAMTPQWWRRYHYQWPDMVLGCEAVDLVMRKLMKATGGIELHAALAHEEHASWWQTHRADPGAEHNRKLAGAWLNKRGLTWD